VSLIRSLSIVLAVALPLFCQAQIVLTGLPHSKGQKTTSRANARTKALELPLWEDFSATRTTSADTTVWFGSESVRVNDGIAIRPPSVRVATFDGVDSTGAPYNGTDILAKGYADKLESLAIDLTTVDVSERNSVYLSFAYQAQGRGESPDIGDRFLVSFRDSTLAWIPVDTINNEALETDRFYWSVIQVTGRFFHDGFKFRMQNFSRLSGPYDTWNIDYIYLNKGRTANDFSFPDRTISEPLTSLFGVYRMMPIQHFRKDTTKTNPTVLATNLLEFIPHGNQNPPIKSQQTFNFSSNVQISYRTPDGLIVNNPRVQLDFQDVDSTFLEKGVYNVVSAVRLPNVGQLSFTSDSIGIEFAFNVDAGDNRTIDPDGDGIVTPGGQPDIDKDEGDYDPAKWAPLDFRKNDTTRASFLLLNKYAYDDGVAEYGAGLNQPGAQLAYEYNLVGYPAEPVGQSGEYLTHLEMYFPRFGDESSQVIELRVWNDLTKEPVYKEIATLQRSQANVFWVKELDPPVAVNKKFYIGWRQSTSAVISAGLDKNTDTGDRMFYNTGGAWVQNTLVHGSLMLRPAFGEADPISGLEEEKALVVYPNPSSGTFRFGGTADRILVYDMTGRTVGFHTETTLDETIVTLPNTSQGIYIIRAYVEGAIRTAKVMIK
jgi:hypothetical protein